MAMRLASCQSARLRLPVSSHGLSKASLERELVIATVSGSTTPVEWEGLRCHENIRTRRCRTSAWKGDSMRDLVADWKKWSPAERILAVVVSLLIVAVPLGVLLTGKLAV
jgi:hypothetical protein